MTTNPNPADAVREALEVMETRWGGYANAKETIRQHIASLESRLAALAGAAPVGLTDAESAALDGILVNLSYAAGDTDDIAPSMDEDEDAYWAWHNFHAITKLRKATHAPAKARGDDLRAVDELDTFERWVRTQWSHPASFATIEGRPANRLGFTWEYNSNDVQAAWSAWMERAALATFAEGAE